MNRLGFVVFFLISIILPQLYAQNVQFSGNLLRQDSNVYLIPSDLESKGITKFKITPVSQEVQSALDLLKDGDYLSGSAEIRANSNMLLYSIDYIGLTELLGSWKIKESGEIINFVNFFLIERPGALSLTYLLSPKSTGLEIIISATSSFAVGTLRNRTPKSFSMEFDNSSKILSFEKLK